MRTNIDIDDRLLKEAMKRTGAPTKKAAVHAALRLLVETLSQTSMRRLRGKDESENNYTGAMGHMNKQRKLGALNRNLKMAQSYMTKLDKLVATKDAVADGFPNRIEDARRDAMKRIAELQAEIAMLLEKSN